jgi:hypothetical protein
MISHPRKRIGQLREVMLYRHVLEKNLQYHIDAVQARACYALRTIQVMNRCTSKVTKVVERSPTSASNKCLWSRSKRQTPPRAFS